jgi:hypothetical protein
MASKNTKKSKPKAKSIKKDQKKTKAAKQPKKAAKNVRKSNSVNKKFIAKKRTVKLTEPVDSLEVESSDIIGEKTEEKTDTYEEHGCEYLNESECEEELNDDGLDVDDVENKHFDESKEE